MGRISRLAAQPPLKPNAAPATQLADEKLAPIFFNADFDAPLQTADMEEALDDDEADDTDHGKMRVDKWLWAARFFKTRSLAKAAIEGGKVHQQGERVKVSREITVGMELTIRQGLTEKTVTIKALSMQRGGAPIAQQLYEETPVSIAKRELIAAHRKLSNLARPDHRPSKHERQQIHRFQRQYDTPDSHNSHDEGY